LQRATEKRDDGDGAGERGVDATGDSGT
jgi:hypothetical protein